MPSVSEALDVVVAEAVARIGVMRKLMTADGCALTEECMQFARSAANCAAQGSVFKLRSDCMNLVVCGLLLAADAEKRAIDGRY